MKIKEVIVVEGKSDTVKINCAVVADTIETNGSEISKATLEQIKHAQEKRGVIIFTDPDYPGERIRRIITEAIPNCKHAFLTKDEARAKHPEHKSLGIEHASPEVIREALRHVYELQEIQEIGESEISREDLFAYRLIAGPGASWRRRRLGEILKIGSANGKQLLKRLQMFHINKEELEKAMNIVFEEESRQ